MINPSIHQLKAVNKWNRRSCNCKQVHKSFKGCKTVQLTNLYISLISHNPFYEFIGHYPEKESKTKSFTSLSWKIFTHIHTDPSKTNQYTCITLKFHSQRNKIGPPFLERKRSCFTYTFFVPFRKSLFESLGCDSTTYSIYCLWLHQYTHKVGPNSRSAHRLPSTIFGCCYLPRSRLIDAISLFELIIITMIRRKEILSMNRDRGKRH